jgi:5-methylthioadenosine/S-adenosylhomocysteine deaminase
MRNNQAGPDSLDPARKPIQERPGAVRRRLIVGARLLTFDPARADIAAADILIEGQKIVAIGHDLADPGDASIERIEGHGHLVMPGLINAHLHSPANFMKGALDSLPLEIFMLYEVPALDAPVEPRAAYVRTMLGAIEMLKGGVTSVQDDAFFIPLPSIGEVDAVMSAYRDSGMRANVALDQPNLPEGDKLPFLTDIVPWELQQRLRRPAAMPMEALLEHYDHLISIWHGAAEGRLGAAVSCSAPQRVTESYFRALDALSARHDLPFYIHMLETRLQRVFGNVKWGGRSLIRYVDELGLLSERMNVIHAVWVDDDDIGLLARSGAHVIHNPISNLRLGSGIMPFRRPRDAGVPIAIATDEAIADDAINLWSASKFAGLVHNIGDADFDHWPKAAEILECLIAGGARSMRRGAEIGRIAPGYQADLIMLDLDTIPFTPLNDLARQLVYCDPGSALRMTMVAGEIVVRDGRMLTVDEPKLRAEARAIAAAEAPRRQRIDEIASEWLPHYRAMYRAMLQHDVGMNRWVGDAAPHRPDRAG